MEEGDDHQSEQINHRNMAPRLAKLATAAAVGCLIIFVVARISSSEVEQREEIAALQTTVRNLHRKYISLKEESSSFREQVAKDVRDLRSSEEAEKKRMISDETSRAPAPNFACGVGLADGLQLESLPLELREVGLEIFTTDARLREVLQGTMAPKEIRVGGRSLCVVASLDDDTVPRLQGEFHDADDVYGTRHLTDPARGVLVDVGANIGMFSIFGRVSSTHSFLRST
jgi:hypothetical protein